MVLTSSPAVTPSLNTDYLKFLGVFQDWPVIYGFK